MKNLIYLLALVLVTSACKKKDPEPENDATGNIAGNVTQSDQYGGTPSELDKVTVSLDNDDVSVVTDKNGNYFLYKVKPGIYTIYFSRPGYGTYQVQQVNFPGNGTLYRNAEIVETPTFTFKSVSVNYNEAANSPWGEITINVKLDPQPREVQAVVFIANTPEVIPYNPKTYYMGISLKIPANTSDFTTVSKGSSQIQTQRPTELYARIYPSAGKIVLFTDMTSKNTVQFGYGEPLAAIRIK